MTPHEIVIDACKQGGSPLSEAQKIFVAGSVALLLEKELQDEREACAQVCEPKSRRPCDCETCYCQNSGDLADVTSWDEATRLAKAIRERSK